MNRFSSLLPAVPDHVSLDVTNRAGFIVQMATHIDTMVNYESKCGVQLELEFDIEEIRFLGNVRFGYENLDLQIR